MRILITAVLPLLLWAQLSWSQQPVYIDVRSGEEYAGGHIEGALLMPHHRIGELIADADLARDTPIVLYCRSGRRAGLAKQTLEELGFTDVTNAGGYRELAAELQQECADQTC